jgi:predicted DNA-binding transcriptional regulator YafY
MSKPPKIQRWIDLLASLLARRLPVTFEELIPDVPAYAAGDQSPETRRRMFERDKDELRSSGIEIESLTRPGVAADEPGTAYRLKARNTYLPYLELVGEPSTDRPYRELQQLALSATELETLDRATRALMDQRDTPFAEAAASARRKLAFDLPLTSNSVDILALPIPEHARQALEVLQDALIKHVAVSCRYFTMYRRAEEERELEPWGLLFQWGRWYCVARPRDRDEPRVFRVDRMRDVKRLSGASAKFSVPKGFDVRTFSRRTPWEFGTGDVKKPVVRFSFPESRWVMNRGVGRVVHQDADRSASIEFEVRDEEAFLRWLLSFGRRADVEQPEALKESLAELRADVAALYAERAP